MQFRQSLFWDANPTQIDPQRNATYIIERIMDFGNDEEVKWMRKEYPRDVLAKVANTSRVLYSSSKTLWTLLTKQR